MEQLSISLVTPSFNQKEFIAETVESVISQAYPSLEYIIMDGGSTDGTMDYLNAIKGKVSYLESKPDLGQSHAINKGLAMAKGEILGWINSDDYLLPGTLGKVNDFFINLPDVDLLYGNGYNLEHGRLVPAISSSFEETHFIRANRIPQPCVFWRRRVHDRIGYLNENLHLMMDFDFWLRIFFTSRVQKVDDFFSVLRAHPSAKTYGTPKSIFKDYRKVMSSFFKTLGDQRIIELLKTGGLLEEGPGWNMNVKLNISDPQQLAAAFIHECAKQEYGWGNNSRARNLALLSNNPSFLADNFFLVLKTILFQNKFK